MSNFYAVRIGRNPGIYSTWDECQEQVDKFSGAIFKKFKNLNEAKMFIKPENGNNNNNNNNGNIVKRSAFQSVEKSVSTSSSSLTSLATNILPISNKQSLPINLSNDIHSNTAFVLLHKRKLAHMSNDNSNQDNTKATSLPTTSSASSTSESISIFSRPLQSNLPRSNTITPSSIGTSTKGTTTTTTSTNRYISASSSTSSNSASAGDANTMKNSQPLYRFNSVINNWSLQQLTQPANEDYIVIYTDGGCKG